MNEHVVILARTKVEAERFRKELIQFFPDLEFARPVGTSGNMRGLEGLRIVRAYVVPSALNGPYWRQVSAVVERSSAKVHGERFLRLLAV